MNKRNYQSALSPTISIEVLRSLYISYSLITIHFMITEKKINRNEKNFQYIYIKKYYYPNQYFSGVGRLQVIIYVLNYSWIVKMYVPSLSRGETLLYMLLSCKSIKSRSNFINLSIGFYYFLI